MNRTSSTAFTAHSFARIALTGAVLLAGISQGACLSSRGPVKMTEPVTRPGAWERVVREHTRQGTVYFWQIRQADVRATLVTPRLRSAYVQDRARFHGTVSDKVGMDLIALGQPPDEGVDAPIKSRPDAEEQIICFVSLYVAESKHKDLGTGYSIWDVELVRGDARVAPLSFEQVKYSPALKALLPHVDRFDSTYIVRFPRTDRSTQRPLLSPGADPLKLEVKSAIGNAIMEWTLKGPNVAEGGDDRGTLPRNPVAPATDGPDAPPAAPDAAGSAPVESEAPADGQAPSDDPAPAPADDAASDETEPDPPADGAEPDAPG